MRSISAIDDRNTRARIRDAALARFAADGFQRTTIRSVAAEAGVSPGLVLHHFTSKEGLRDACDYHVVDELTARIEPWLVEPEQRLNQPGAMAELFADSTDMLAYIGRAMVEGGERTDALVDRLIDITEQLLAESEARGRLNPYPDPRARAAVLVLWDMSAIILGRHLSRALGETDQESVMHRYGEFAGEIFTRGLTPSGTPGND